MEDKEQIKKQLYKAYRKAKDEYDGAPYITKAVNAVKGDEETVVEVVVRDIDEER